MTVNSLGPIILAKLGEVFILLGSQQLLLGMPAFGTETMPSTTTYESIYVLAHEE